MTRTKTRVALWISAILLTVLPSFSKDKKKVTNLFDAPPAQVYDAVYHYAQHHGTIKFADEKRFTLSGVIIVPGGNWDFQKQFDCTISVEPTGDGRKSLVDVVGTFPAKQQSLIGSLGEGPAVKVLKAIHDEFDGAPSQKSQQNEAARPQTEAGAGDTPPRRSGTATGPDLATVTVKSTPDAGDVTVDGKYAGDTPSTIRLVPGDHTIVVNKPGYRNWQRTVTLTPGGSVTITASLDKE